MIIIFLHHMTFDLIMIRNHIFIIENNMYTPNSTVVPYHFEIVSILMNAKHVTFPDSYHNHRNGEGRAGLGKCTW